ncbi:hypothetical protein PoHVEF18_002935 [Penicillium ochrochloron]
MPKPKKSDPKPPPPTRQQPPTQPPNWPPLRPLLPTTDLRLTPLVPDQIYLIRNFLPATLCKTYASFLLNLPLTTTPGRPKKDEAVRVNDRFQVQDARFAEMLWGGTALRELVLERFDEDEEEYEDERKGREEDEQAKTQKLRETWGGQPLGLNPNIRIYRYSKGQFFAQHYDESNTLTYNPPSTTKSIPALTTWTLLIYLTTCTGGETVFYPDATRAHPNPEPIAVAPEVGMALLHRHGDRCMVHEGRVVTGGEKWVVRSDLVVAR